MAEVIEAKMILYYIIIYSFLNTYYVNEEVHICVDMFCHHERKNIFEIRCVATIFFGAVKFRHHF
jgi:hypothetical protein